MKGFSSVGADGDCNKWADEFCKGVGLVLFFKIERRKETKKK
jgi:hypothetical protein